MLFVDNFFSPLPGFDDIVATKPTPIKADGESPLVDRVSNHFIIWKHFVVL